MSTLVLNASLVDLPDGSVSRTIDQRLTLNPGAERRLIELTSDSAFVVNLDGFTGIHAIEIESTAKITAKITTADGTDQLLPVDPLLILFSRSTPITALGLIRVSGQDTTVGIVLGQKA